MAVFLSAAALEAVPPRTVLPLPPPSGTGPAPSLPPEGIFREKCCSLDKISYLYSHATVSCLNLNKSNNHINSISMKKIVLILALAGISVSAFASRQDTLAVDNTGKNNVKVLQDEKIDEYRRSSLYQVLVKHSGAAYGSTIDSVFMMMGTPDKFNDHDLAVKSFESTAKKAKKVKADVRGTDKDPNISDITAFLSQNHVAREMVAKWFGRDPETGNFNTDLVVDRGYYDASQAAIEEADASLRGRAMLADAGFELIDKTFMTVNDITFIDHGERSAKAGAGIKAGLSVLGALTSAVTGDDSYQELGDASGNLIGTIANEIAGYKVNIITYLYKLDWNEDVQNEFYSKYWVDGNTAPEERAARKAAFETSDLFRLEYLGYTETSAENVSSKTFSQKPLQEQFLKVCTRAVDKAIVELQREYDEFKVNVPIYSVNEDGTVDVKIGLKEGVNEKSRYEVLMPDRSSGVTQYKKVGMLKPVPGKIWDNRFGAKEEAAMLEADRKAAEAEAAAAGEGTEEAAKAEVEAEVAGAEEAAETGDAYLTATTFSIVSGAGNIYPGLLIREETIKNVK